ncbi:MAG: hypothetical protein MZV64_16985 [Ignavibacteriales bacterium]|nr:hypothetical protein [Ignavibacteriales bacterium]
MAIEETGAGGATIGVRFLPAGDRGLVVVEFGTDGQRRRQQSGPRARDGLDGVRDARSVLEVVPDVPLAGDAVRPDAARRSTS